MRTRLVALIISLLVTIPAYSQNEFPPAGNLTVATPCMINEGYTIGDVVEAARMLDFSGENAPHFFFIRQPVSGSNIPAGGIQRVVYWSNLEHWAAGSPQPSFAGEVLNERMTCLNENRTFAVNRGVGPGAGVGPYMGGQADSSLVATRGCTINEGATLEEVWTALYSFNQTMREQGDQSLVQLVHRFTGPSAGVEQGTRFMIRVTGRTAAGLARRIDMMPKWEGTPEGMPASCGDYILWNSHLIHWDPPQN